MTKIAHRVFGFAVLVASLSGLGGRVVAAQDYKPDRLIETAQKVSFSHDDRKFLIEWLAGHPELRPAPRPISLALRDTDRWSSSFDGYATRLPRRVELQLAPLPEGFVRRVLDRSIWLVGVDSGDIIDHVDEP